MTRKPDQDAAYALQSPDAARKLYADWADSYDSAFADAQDYLLPAQIARAFAVAGGQGPVLDVGAGTGLCGQALADWDVSPIDATDLSAEMLSVAQSKDIYRDTIEADLTRGLPVPAGSYAGIVSSGTFTTGHIGPDALDTLLRAARPGALFALSIKIEHYDSAGFAAKFADLAAQISDFSLTDVAIHGPGATGSRKDDRAYVALFRKI